MRAEQNGAPCQDPDIRQLSGTETSRDAAYTVESATRAGLTHTVTVTEDGPDDRWTCMCEAGRHGVPCWHRDYVRAVHYWYRYERRHQTRRQRAMQVAAHGASQAARPAGLAALQEAYG